MEKNKYLDEFRASYPMYKDMDNVTLAKNIHQTFYKDMNESDYMAKLGLYSDMPQDKKEEVISQYKTTTPNNWGDKIKKDIENIGNSIDGISQTQTPANIASSLPINNNDTKELDTILNPNRDKIDIPSIPTLDEQNSNLIDQIQSSILQQSRETARMLTKNVKKGLEQTSGLKSVGQSITPLESIDQKEADKIVGYSKEDRAKDNENTNSIRDSFDKGNYGTAFVKTVKELPSILGDSTGEMFSLLTLPSTALAIQTRVSKFEDEYIKNNDGKTPDQAWYDEAFLSQGVLILGERLGLKKLGEMALGKMPKKISTPVAVGGAGLYEYGQEGGEYVSEEYLTQKEGDKTLLEIATSPDAKFNAFVGGVAGTTLGGVAKTTETLNGAINPTEEQKKEKIIDELNKSIENTDLQQEDILNQLNPNQAYYQNQDPTPIANNNLEQITKGFENLREEIKLNNDKSVEELLQEDLKVKANEPISQQTGTQIPDNNIATNQEVQIQDSPLPVPTINENSNTNTINENENTNISTESTPIDSADTSIQNNIDETQWHSIPDNIDIKISQGSNRANDLTVKDLNKNNDPYIYETAEIQTDNGVTSTINRKLANEDELLQKNKNSLVDTKFQNYFDNASIDENGFMTTKSMSKEQFKEFNDYIKENNIGSYVNKKYSQGGKTGFKIDNQDVINAWFNQDESGSSAPIINSNEKIGSFEINPITKDATLKRLIEHNKNLGFKGTTLKQESEAMLDKIDFDKVTGLATGIKKINITPQIDKNKINIGENINARSEATNSTTMDNRTVETKQQNNDSTTNRELDKRSNEDLQKIDNIARSIETGSDRENARVNTGTNKQIKLDINKLYSTSGIPHEIPSNIVSKQIQKDVAKYVGDLAGKLGYEIDTDKKGKKLTNNGVSDNIAPAGGNTFFILWKPSSNNGIYVSLQYNLTEDSNFEDAYKLDKEFMWRTTSKNNKFSGDRNIWEKIDFLNNENFINDILEAVDNKDLNESKSDIIKQDNKEVKEDGNTNDSTTNRTTGELQGDVLDSTRGNESRGVQPTTQDEQTIEASNQNLTTDDARPRPTDERGNDSTTSTRDSDTQLHSRNVKLTNDSFTLNQDRLYDSGELARFNSNIKAIKLIKENKTFYTDEEKQIISSYTGFGGLQKAFKDVQGNWVDGWKERGEELKLLLTADEYKAIERGILDAFYTPLPTIKTMWDISSKLGFKGGLVLEPSIGTGRFVGMTPDNLKLKTSFNGIEIDPITYKVAKTLYSKVNMRNRGFEDTNYDSNHDMVIGNPPYGEFKLYDKYNKEYNSLSAHNYFIVKALDALKEGGILNFVISASFLDNIDSKTSELINNKAKLIGAIRLPSDIFKGAGTNVTTDIVIFQKLRSGEIGNIDTWNKKSELNGYKINQYFIDNESMLLGNWVKGFRNNGKLVKGISFDDDLQNAINKLPENIMNYESNITQKDIETLSDNSVPENTMYIRKDKVFVNVSQKGNLVPEELNIKKEKAKDYIDLKESLKNIINMQLDINTDENVLNNERKILNQRYENFVKKYGPLNKTQNRSQIVKDRDGYLVLTLEENYKQEIKPDNKRGLKPRKESFSKADILTKRTISPQQEIQTDNSEEALIFSLNTKGFVDIEYIAKLTNKPTENILQDLKGKIFYDNDLGYVTKDVFLTGDVKTKYANATDEYAKEELRKVIPKDVEAKDIKTEFGQKWIDKKYFAQFLEEKAGFQRYNLSQSDITSTWYFEGSSYSFPYKASKVDDKKIVESALNSKQIRVTYKGADDKIYLDQQATDYANTQVEKLKEDFEDWIFKDSQRREYLVKKYNEVKNRYVSMDENKFDDLIDNYNIPNLSHFEPRLHQKKAVYKAVFNNSPLLLNHTVGSGKTLTSQMIAMEWRRLGKAKKPLIATLKAVVPQYAKEFKEAYPNAKIIVPTDADFTPVNRKRLLSSIATGDYDAVIITHDQLKMIENPSELQNEMIETEIDDVINAITELENMRDSDSNKTKRDLIKKKEALETRYEALKDSKKDLDVLSFDKLGIDGLIIDESHKFKKLAYSSSLGQIKGMPDQKGSKMAFDLYVKVQHILNTTNSRNIVFMTGTPITNTVPELYLIQKYLQNDLLKQQGISNFDSYAKDYISQSTEVEITATGGFKEVTRIKEFKNMPMLIQSTQQIIDTVTNEDIKKASKNFKLPPLKNNKPTLVFLEPTESQLAYNEELVKRVANIKKDSPDNHLVIFNDAAKMSIDMRLISDKYRDEKDSKINAVVNRAFDKFKEFDNVKGTQLIFSDLGTPKSDKDKALIERLMLRAEDGDSDAIKELENYNDAEIDDILNGGTFSVYEDIKRKLIKKGIPSNEIVFIHDYNTKEKKIELNEEVRAGRIRFVIGSTQKLGTGINVQERLVAVHHIDIPYTPAELEQRNGRIIRQGNKLLDEIKDFNIEIFYYATKRTLDGMKWQILENKSKFIQQFFDGVSNDDIEIEEMSNSELAERMKAEASGNPLLIDKIKLEKQIKKLRNLKRGAELAKSEKRDRIKVLEVAIKEHDKSIINYEKDAQIVKDSILLIDGKNYEKATDLGNAVYDIAANIVNKKIKSTQHLGNIGEIELSISYDIYSDKVRIDFTGNSLTKIEYDFTDETPLKIANAINRKVAGYETSLNNYKSSLTSLKRELSEIIGNEDKPFEKEKELEDLVSQHSTIIQTISKQASNQNNQSTKDEDTNTSYMKISDEAMPNNPERLTGKASVRVDDKMSLRDKEITLPDKFAPMTPANIRKQVIDIIGNRLYFSKIKQKAEGLYKKRTGETRIKDINNVEVYAHEMAHFLDFYNGNKIFRNAYKSNEFKSEVESFSYTKNDDHKSIEGFAEFVRAWLSQYEFAKSKAPNFTKEFELILKETKLESKMNKLQEDMHKWYNQGDEAMFSALIGDKKSKLDALKETIFNIKHTIMNKTLVNIFDRTHGFSVAEFTMFNKLQKAEQSPTKLLRLAIGGSSATYESVIKWGTPTLTRNGDLAFNGKGLSDIFEPVLKQGSNEFKELMEYFAAVQANEMVEQGKKTPFSKSQIETILKRGNDKPLYKRVFKEYQDFNNRMLDFYVQMDYLTPQDVENFRNKNNVYIPMQRVVESMGQKDGQVSSGFFGRKGSDRNIRDIEKNITEQLFYHIRGAMLAHAKSKLFSQLSRHEDGSLFAVNIAPDTKKVKVNIEQQAKKIVEILFDAGMMLDINGDIIEIEENVTLDEAINNTIDVLIYKPQLMSFLSFGHKPKNAGSNIEEVIINGEKKYFEIQTGDLGDILNITLNNLGGIQYGWFMGALYAFKNFKTRAITAMPQFKLPNFIRDTLDAQVFRKTKKPINPLAGAKSYFTIDDAFKNYMLNGGGYGTLLESSTTAKPDEIFKETKWQQFDRLMSFDEYSNRVSVAERAIEEGSNWTDAAYQGRDLTVDFSMVGANPILRSILKLLPFQQAAMNGMYKLIREIKDEGHNPTTYGKAVSRLALKGFTYLTPIAIVAFLMNDDDERYKALTTDEMARFIWFFYDKNEQPIKIPVPFGLGAIFQKFPEYIMSMLFSDGDFVDKRYSDAVMFAVTHQIIAVPNGGIFDPILQDLMNKDFTGSPIVSSQLKKIEPYLQYTNRTPEIYKEIGKATGLSPLRLEHYTKGTLGYIESAITGMTQIALWDKEKYGEMPYSSKEDYIHGAFFKQFYKMNETSRTAWSEEYYKYREKVEEAYNSVQFTNKQIIKDKGDSYENYLNKKDKMLLSSLKEFTTNIDKITAQLKKAEDAIIFDKNLSANEKEKKIDEIYKQENIMFKEVYKQIDKAIKENK